MTAIDFNAPRFRVGTDHVESWFVRANDPASPRALWLKATVLTKVDGITLSQAWCSVFDGDRTQAFWQDAPLAEASFAGSTAGREIEIGPVRLGLTTAGGTSVGALGSEAGSVALPRLRPRCRKAGRTPVRAAERPAARCTLPEEQARHADARSAQHRNGCECD